MFQTFQPPSRLLSPIIVPGFSISFQTPSLSLVTHVHFCSSLSDLLIAPTLASISVPAISTFFQAQVSSPPPPGAVHSRGGIVKGHYLRIRPLLTWLLGRLTRGLPSCRWPSGVGVLTRWITARMTKAKTRATDGECIDEKNDDGKKDEEKHQE